ncbi:MAG TPA: hypothetical protein VNG31_01060, partial [Candidatus Baltobacteraceae bacterium]|nr:hypothetical protein [Candidatus Baltobacteraceae bacterium]
MKRVICAGTMAALSALVFSACSGGSGLTPSASGQGAGFTSPAFMDAAKRPRAGTKIVKLAWGKVPAARAGATVTVKLTLTAKAKNGKAIKGAYANPVSLADSDKSGATKLLINGKAASKKNRVKKSTDKISLRYTGLAISPATLTASAAKVKAAKATFSPSIGGIAYTCTSSSSQTCSTTAASPEIDL